MIHNQSIIHIQSIIHLFQTSIMVLELIAPFIDVWDNELWIEYGFWIEYDYGLNMDYGLSMDYGLNMDYGLDLDSIFRS